MIFLLLISMLSQCEAFVTSFPHQGLLISSVHRHAKTNRRQSGDVSQLEKHQILVVLDSNTSISPFTTKPLIEPVTWSSVFHQIQEKMSWEAPNGRFNGTLGALGFEVLNLDQAYDIGTAQTVPPIVMLVGLNDDGPGKLEIAKNLSLGRTTVVALDCAAAFESLQVFGKPDHGYFDSAESEENVGSKFLTRWWRGIFSKNGSKKNNGLSDEEIADSIREVWARRSSDDVLFALLLLINSYYLPFKNKLSSVVAATSSDKTGFKELACMCTKCSKELFSCLSDPQCKKALDCLDKCKANDQVCAYKCITSYETLKFEEFSQCILQRHNCLGNSASIPLTPDPSPLLTFRSQPLTFEVAEGIFEGHLMPRPGEQRLCVTAQDRFSWMVCIGVNPAYDMFSDQHQIFYRERSRPKIMWYDPVFKVQTLDGQEVWRRRHYRVRRGNSPGRFRFTVLDNGVLSDEYWRILDADDDLDWAVFYYSGAASAAGTSYTGALIVTRDGSWPLAMRDPSSQTYQRIKSALGRGGIELWEVYEVSNSIRDGNNLAGPPPLGIV